jgi:hypothetical protein
MKKALLLLAFSLPLLTLTSCGPTEEEVKEAEKKMEPEKIEDKAELNDLEKELEGAFNEVADSVVAPKQ